jgi:hypothetical protein
MGQINQRGWYDAGKGVGSGTFLLLTATITVSGNLGWQLR